MNDLREIRRDYLNVRRWTKPATPEEPAQGVPGWRTYVASRNV